jgi:hypothetical protein
MLLAISQPRDCFTVAIIMLTICAINFYVVIFQPRLLRRFHISWGRFGGGVPVSRLGCAAWGLAFGIFGLAAILAGYGVLPNSRVPFMVLAGFILVVAAGFYDTFKHRRRWRVAWPVAGACRRWHYGCKPRRESEMAQLSTKCDTRLMTRSIFILLLVLLAVPALIDAYMVFQVIKVYAGQNTFDRAQSDMRLAYNVQFQSIGAAAISLLGLHFCSVLGVKARHPLHIGFVVTTLLTIAILFVSRFVAAKYVIWFAICRLLN